MKYALSCLIFATVALTAVLAYPGSRGSPFEREVDFDKEEPVIVLSEISPLEDGFGSGFFGSVRDPFDGFLSSVRGMIDGLKQQISQNFPNMHQPGSFFGFQTIPEGANTTSTTKVINGHVVTINETTYSDGDDVQGTVVRVRVIDVKPENDPAIDNPDAESATPDSNGEETTATSTDRSIESVEDFEGNEIPKAGVDTLTA